MTEDCIKYGTSGQRPPRKNTYPQIWRLVAHDITERAMAGRKKYGTYLQPFNGRNALVDAYQEALDLVIYLRQELYERTGKQKEEKIEDKESPRVCPEHPNAPIRHEWLRKYFDYVDGYTYDNGLDFDHHYYCNECDRELAPPED